MCDAKRQDVARQTNEHVTQAHQEHYKARHFVITYTETRSAKTLHGKPMSTSLKPTKNRDFTTAPMDVRRVGNSLPTAIPMNNPPSTALAFLIKNGSFVDFIPSVGNKLPTLRFYYWPGLQGESGHRSRNRYRKPEPNQQPGARRYLNPNPANPSWSNNRAFGQPTIRPLSAHLLQIHCGQVPCGSTLSLHPADQS